MNILLAGSEAVPFAKTGGLADVMAALPVELEQLGHRPVVFLPGYSRALNCGQPIEPTDVRVRVPIGSKTVEGRLLRSRLPDSGVEVYLVEQDDYYRRDDLYGAGGADYVDNCERFVFFSRAVLEAVRQLR